MLSRCLLLVALICFQSCAATVYTWQDLPDTHRWQTLSEEERTEREKKFGIEELKLISSGHYIGFSTALEPGTTYDLFSYAPVMSALYPGTQNAFQQAQQLEQTGQWVTYTYLGAGLAYGIWSVNGLLAEGPGANVQPLLWTYALGFLSYLGVTAFFASQEIAVYTELQQGFNTALREALTAPPPQNP